MGNPIFRLVALKDADDFFESLSPVVRRKVFYNIDKVANGIKDPEIFKKLENTEIWEFRTLWQGIAYRLFAFWDKDEETLVIATHGIIKKSNKTPLNDIRKAQRLRKEYFEIKKNK